MTREEIQAIEQEMICLKNLEPQKVDWLWYPYIPRGKLTIMQGDPGEGKTTLALQLAALVTRGFMYGKSEKELAGTVLFQSAEDGIRDTIIPRLMGMGADRSRINTIREDLTPLTLTDERLAKVMEIYSPDLLVIDPLQAYLGANVDMHRANEVRPVLSHVAELAEYYGTAVLLIGHMNKMTGLKALYKGLGSIDITAAARSVLLVAKNPQDPGMLLMGHVKSSLAPAGPVVGFERTEKGLLQFLGEQQIEVQRMLEGQVRVRPRDKAAEFLQEYLADGKTHLVPEVVKAAAELGITKGTLDRAAKELDIAHSRIGNQFFMALSDAQEPERPSDEKINMEEYYSEELGRYLTPMDFEPLPYR